MKIRVYLDEDVPSSFAYALINRGVDMVTTQQAKISDNLMQNSLYTQQKKKELFLPTTKETLFCCIRNIYNLEKSIRE